MRARVALVMLASIAGLVPAGACGRQEAVAVPPRAVPVKIVPAQLPPTDDGPPLTLSEYKPAVARIASAGDRSMVDDGRVWEIRRGSTLVGALQVSTLKSRVDVARADQRRKLAALVLSGSVQRISVSGVEVIASQTTDKVVYLWFGNQLFEVLQIKGAGIQPEAMLKGILDFQRPSGELKIRPR